MQHDSARIPEPNARREVACLMAEPGEQPSGGERPQAMLNAGQSAAADASPPARNEGAAGSSSSGPVQEGSQHPEIEVRSSYGGGEM